MKGVLRKEFLREILKNKGRFLSIFFIVMLGAAFFAGIRSAGGDMKATADRYYDDTELMDIRVLSTMGLTEEDVQDINKLEETELAVGGYSMDVLLKEQNDELAVKLIADNKQVNRCMLEAGREIQKSNECIMDARFMKNRGYALGDLVKIVSGTDTPLEDSLTEQVFTIVGYGNLPYYMDLTRGVGSIGDGSLSGYLVVAPEVFDLDVYTEVYIKVKGSEELNSYSDAYKELTDSLVDKLEGMADSCEQRRYDLIRKDAEEKIADGKQEITDAKQELQDAKEELDDGEEKLKDGKKELQDAKKELDDGEEKLKDGEKELKDAKKELDDGQTELQDAKKVLDDGQKELQDSKGQLDAAEKQLKDGRSELDQGKTQLEAAEAELKAGEEKAAKGKEELDKGAEELSAAKEQLDEAETQLADSLTQLEEGRKELDDNRAALEDGRAELESQEAVLVQREGQLNTLWQLYQAGAQTLEWMKQYLPPESQLLQELERQLASTYDQLSAMDQLVKDGRAELEQQKTILEEGEAQLAEGEARYQEGLEAYEQGLAEYNTGKETYETSLAAWQKGQEEWEAGNAALEEGRKQLEASRATYLAGEEEWAKGNRAFEDGKAQYQAGLDAYEQGKTQYEEGQKTWEEGDAAYRDGLEEYESGRKKLEDGKKEYEDGLEEYESNLKKWKDGKQEYEDAEAEALPKIADAEEELKDAEEKLKDLKKPEWYVLDRDKIQSCVSYGMDADRMRSLGNVFPVLFFLVAALVSLTAMTRMVEEQRQQIGTMKALGYGSSAIAGKYFGYAMLATLTGAVIGVVIGEKVLPWVILSAYGMLYAGLPYLDTPLNLTQGVLAVVLSALCTGGATLAACYRMLSSSPAKLMRPEAPMGGSRILLERITFLWKRFSFTRKSTLRNLFRYKKRFIMTIIGIGGCMGLMLVGFGIRDSITVVAQNQYVEIFMQDATVSVDTTAEEEEIEKLLSSIEGNASVDDSMQVALNSVTLNANGKDRSASLYVPEDVEKAQEYVRFRNRVTKEKYPYPVSGAALSEKTANMLGVKVGDTVRIQKGEGEPYVELPV
ncbi:MAG: FtsX-like permease family protein, partial [Lachnospiraceae bacterium]|nr:FtsX-like permease family protein [Lachnospiraceae bacterium]